MFVPLIPPLLLLGIPWLDARLTAASDAAASAEKVASEIKRDERAGYDWAAHDGVARESACVTHSPAYTVGCWRYVASRAAMSEAELDAAGKSWLFRQSIYSEEACASSSRMDFDDRPAFIAGCKEGVRILDRGRGEVWATERQIAKETDCRPGVEGFKDTPEFIDGCLEAVGQALRTAGADWAASHHITSMEDCVSAPGAEASPAIVQGCEGLLRPYDDARPGFLFAINNRLTNAALCRGVTDGTSQFLAACERGVREHLRDRGRRWVFMYKIQNEDDCTTGGTAVAHKQFEADPDFAESCRRVVIQQKRG